MQPSQDQHFLSGLNPLWYRKNAIAVFKIPPMFPREPGNALSWALEMVSRDNEFNSTAMRNSLAGHSDDEKGMMYVTRGNVTPQVKAALIQGVSEGAAIQLQVLGLGDKYPPIRNFVDQAFTPVWNALHPGGYMAPLCLWATGPGHTYDVHCDTGDHLLFQLHGQKNITFWMPREDFDAEPLSNLNFRDDPERFFGEKLSFEVQPGECIYFSRGIMHEVSVPGPDSSVSLTVACDWMYPFLNLLEDLHTMDPAFHALQPTQMYAHWDKFRAYRFDPTRWLTGPEQERMPLALKEAIMEACTGASESDLSRGLNTWWRNYVQAPTYPANGALAKAPPNREAQLKAWEAERLQRL